MVDVLARNWGWVALRGVAAVVFGLLALLDPAITLAALVLLFGAYALADGLLTVVSAVVGRRKQPHWMALLVSGALSVGVGVLTFVWPRVTALALLYLIAAWAVLVGLAEVVVALRLRRVITGEWLLALAGVLSVAFGLLLFAFPGAGALTAVVWIGAYALVTGALMIALALRLRSWHREGRGVSPRV